MLTSRTAQLLGDMQFGGGTLEAVADFKYLGSTVSNDDDIKMEINLRIAAGSKCSWALNSILKSRLLTRATKQQVYVTIIRPIVLYGCETWRTTKEIERKLEVFERSVLRRIWGPVRDSESGEWRRRRAHGPR